jgi:hypothetical protein
MTDLEIILDYLSTQWLPPAIVDARKRLIVALEK